MKFPSLVIVCVLFCVPVTRAEAASFNCNAKLNAVEAIICQNETINGYDNQLAIEYKEVSNQMSPNRRKMLQQDQKRWLSYRDATCTMDTVHSVWCLSGLYEERLALLNSSADLEAFLNRATDPIQAPANTEARRAEVIRILNKYNLTVKSSVDADCAGLAADFPSQKDIEHLRPAETSSNYQTLVKMQLNNCPNLELRTPYIASPPWAQYYLYPPTLAVYEIDKANGVYVFLDQSFHVEWSKAEGTTLESDATYRPVNVKTCYHREHFGDFWIGGGISSDKMRDVHNVDPVDLVHGLIAYRGRVFSYLISEDTRGWGQVVINRLDGKEAPEFRQKCLFHLQRKP